MNRRQLLKGAAALLAIGNPTPSVRAADSQAVPPMGAFDRTTVRRLAQDLARQPFQEASISLPDALASLTYDKYRTIRFRKERALWRGQGLPFQVEFFPRGFLYPSAVDVFEVAAGRYTQVGYSPDMFEYGDLARQVPDDLGFAGFRVHAPINRPDYFDEVCVFLGASYFRAVAKGQVYGLSARGFAIDTGNPHGEEFARFRAFWLERPQPGETSLVIGALLDSRSLAGAFRFTLHPGSETIFDVESAIYPRADIKGAGVAPLTTMYDFDANNRQRVDDWRPAAHDSDGLSMWSGRDQQIWRPLVNPTEVQISAFADTTPRGFGLLQRKRAFADYQDLEVQYGRRPSLWIEPIGDWGRGDVELVEIPTPNEMNDNIVAFWRPKDNLKARGEYTFNYRMHWAWDRPWGSRLARIVDTRVGVTADRKGRLFVLDITGEAVKALPPDSRLHADVGTSRGVLRNVVVQPNQDIGGWRVTFELIPADTQVADMHCVLLDEHGPLSETWIYRWTP